MHASCSNLLNVGPCGKPTFAMSSPARVMLHRRAILSCLARVMVTLGGMAARAGCFSSSWAAAGDGTSNRAARDSRRALR
jgi:hypothetical protein